MGLILEEIAKGLLRLIDWIGFYSATILVKINAGPDKIARVSSLGGTNISYMHIYLYLHCSQNGKQGETTSQYTKKNSISAVSRVFRQRVIWICR